MQPRATVPGSRAAASSSALLGATLEPGTVLSALTTLEALYDAVVQQQSRVLSSFSAMQSADQVCKCLC